MKLQEILLGALLLCNCQLANSASATLGVNITAQDKASNQLLAQERSALGEVFFPSVLAQARLALGEETLSAGVSFRAPSFLAQIIPDNTLDNESSTVVPNAEVQGVPAELIEGGAERGTNLFHSFAEFNVGEGQNVYFANPEGIANIFSRVTGNDVSDIMGTLGVNGGADLFLINPNGIIFGENASLDVNGSFVASTADSLVFSNYEFGATNPDAPPLLTVNMPLGLNLGNNPGSIINRSIAQNSEANLGLEVSEGNNLSFVGGKIEFEGGQVTAPEGMIELGGLSTAGTVNISDDGSLNFPRDVAKADVALSNGAVANVRGAGGGNVVINASNLNLSEDSLLIGGIDSISSDATAGDIEINLSDQLTIDRSRILNTVEPGGAGNAGNINIITDSILVINDGQIDASTSGMGNGGNITINARGNINFDGDDDGTNEIVSSAVSLVNEQAVGDAGNITIFTEGNFALTNGGRVDVGSNNQGNAGNITIEVMGDLSFEGEDSEGFGSGVTSFVNPKGTGDAGNVIISAQGSLTLKEKGRVEAINNSNIGGDAGTINVTAGGNLTLGNQGRIDAANNSQGEAGNINIFGGELLAITDEGRIEAGNNGQGDAGNINISVGDDIFFSNGGQVNTSVNGRGNGGDIKIEAVGDIFFDGNDTNGAGSGATSLVGDNVEGNAGDIMIATQGKLSLTNGGRIDVSSNQGEGNAGLIEITTGDDILFAGEDERGFGSGATSQVNPGATGNSGGIVVVTQGDLTLKDGGRIDTSTDTTGDAGLVDITVSGDVLFEGKASNGDGSGVTSQANPQAAGSAGVITISTEESLTLRNGGRIDTSISAMGGETINPEARSPTTDNANIILQVADNIFLDNNGLISARASGDANGGNLNIDTGFIVAVPNSNSDIIANAEQGQGGNIVIDAKSIFGIEERPLNNLTNDINASSEFNSPGTVEIDILETDPSQDSLNIPVATVETKVTQTCNRNSDESPNELVVTGRGGLPDALEANLDGGFVLEDWRVADSHRASSDMRSPEDTIQNEQNQKPIVEAEGWLVNQQGKVVLVAASNHSHSSNITQPANCSAN